MVITGLGIVSPLGSGLAEFSEGLRRGEPRSAVDFDPAVLARKGLRSIDRTALLLLGAARQALDMAALPDPPEDIGVAAGSEAGLVDHQFDYVGQILAEGAQFASPNDFVNTGLNSTASRVSVFLGLEGPNTSVLAREATALQALEYAVLHLRRGLAGAYLAGASYSLGKLQRVLLERSGEASAEGVARPYDRRRTGIVLGEGAAMVVLEDEGRARARGAAILARVEAVGSAFAPDRRVALERAGQAVLAGPPTWVAGMGNGGSFDPRECEVLARLGAPVSAVKSLVGEGWDAGGALQLAAAVASLQGGFVPPTAGLEQPEADLDFVTSLREGPVERVLVHSVSQHGQAAAAMLSRV